jgi:hypothetical protein
MEPILFLAPNQALAAKAASACAHLNVQLTIQVAALKEARAAVQAHAGMQVIISRGGVASELRKATSTPVIGVLSTMSDVLAAIHTLAQGGARRIGVVVNAMTLDDGTQDLRIGDLEVFLRPWQEPAEARRSVETLARMGVTAIVGDGAGLQAAQDCGMAGAPLDSGVASVERALREALQLSQARTMERAAEHVHSRIRASVQEIHAALETAADAIQALTSSSQKIAATVGASATIGKRLHHEVDQSAEILNLIRQLGNRTNVLGLNASIEAANAGKFGRGFTVVAKEVRNLADENARSVGSIFSMLENIRASVDQVLGQVEQAQAGTEAQARAAAEMSTMLEGLRQIGRQLLELQK